MKTKTMKYLVLCHILVFLLCVGDLSAQTVVQDSAQVAQSTQANVQAERTAWNTVHLELLGMGGLWSVTYERSLTNDISVRAGFGNQNLPIGPFYPIITINGFLGQGEHRSEVGVGYTPGSTDGRSWTSEHKGIMRVGYRYQPLRGGINFALAFTPWIYFRQDFSPSIFPWGGISLGWGF